MIQTPTWLLYFCVFSLQKKHEKASKIQGANYEVQEMFIIVDIVPLSAWRLTSLRFSRCSSTILNRQPLSLWNDRPTPAEALTAASHRRVSVQPLSGLLGIMGSFKHPFGLFGLGRNEVPMLERHCQHSTFFSFLGRGLCMAHGSALACPNPLLQCSCSPQIFSGIWWRVEPRNWFSENRTMASQ